MTRHVVNFRYYGTDGVFIGAHKTPVADYNRAKTLAPAVLRLDALFHDPLGLVAPLMPTNISVRGPRGRFVKWKK